MDHIDSSFMQETEMNLNISMLNETTKLQNSGLILLDYKAVEDLAG